MPKERNKADGYREKVPIKREKIDACIDSSEREVSRPILFCNTCLALEQEALERCILREGRRCISPGMD